MLKNVEKKKFLVVLGVIALTIMLFGNGKAFATDGSSFTITPTTDNTSVTANSSGTTITPTTSNNSTNNTNTNTNNTSTYNNTSSTVANNSNLPYTGSDSKTMLFMIAFAISAIYAYKKVSDYNM